MAKKNEVKVLLDLALHPVRMRILTQLSGSQGLTPQQMAEQLNDIPQATLYRNINRLVQGGLLMVVEERPVRGTLEKVYALNTSGENLTMTAEDAADAFNRVSKEDHLRYFTTFALSLVDDFARYLNRETQKPPRPAADGVGYHKLPLFLSDDELAEFGTALNQAIAPYLEMKAAPGREKRLLSIIMMPSDEPLTTSDETQKTNQ